MYQAKRPFLALDRRITYIIDPRGLIAAAFRYELDAARHEEDVRLFFERQP